MVTEYGIFTEEGCIEAQLYDRDYAEEAAVVYRAEAEAEGYDETYTVKEICPEHDGEPSDSCEACWEYDEAEDAA